MKRFPKLLEIKTVTKENCEPDQFNIVGINYEQSLLAGYYIWWNTFVRSTEKSQNKLRKESTRNIYKSQEALAVPYDPSTSTTKTRTDNEW